jgi:hypothetical protein
MRVAPIEAGFPAAAIVGTGAAALQQADSLRQHYRLRAATAGWTQSTQR